MRCPCYKSSVSQGGAGGWWHVSSLFWTEGCNAKKTKQSKHSSSFSGCSGGEEKVRKREPVCSAETSKQSKPQMPLFINTQREADVYPGQSREKKLAKARERDSRSTNKGFPRGRSGR